MPTGRSLVAALSLTQTAGYGLLFYTFSVTLLPLTADLHTSSTVVAGALTLSLLVSAVAAVPVGRRLDRRGGRGLMTAGSVLATVAVLVWSRVDTVTELYLAFVLIGLASALVLYEAAFAVVVQRIAPDRRANALLGITLVAGFSPTVFLPLAGLLVRHSGWRWALVLLAIGYAAIAVPLHARFVPPAAPERSAPAARQARSLAIGQALREWGFWTIVVAFVAHGLAVWTVAVHIVAMLVWFGHPAAAAAAMAGLIGLLSVAGRLVATRFGVRFGMAPVTAVIFGTQAVAMASLPLIGRTLAGAIIGIVLFGLGYGVGTIARPALLAERYGTTAFGTIAGVLNLPVTVAKAVGPLALAALYTATGSYAGVCLVVAGASTVAATMLAITPPASPSEVGRALRSESSLTSGDSLL